MRDCIHVVASFAAFGLLALSPAAAQAAAKPKTEADVLAALREHWQKVTPDLGRYRGLAFYGETTSSVALGKDVLHEEREFWASAASAKMLESLPIEVCLLGHNLLVHDPEGCPAYLAALHAAAERLAPTDTKTADSRRICDHTFEATVVAGEAGEQAVVSHLGHLDASVRRFWAHYLAVCAIHRSSATPIEKRLAVETDGEVRAQLLRALTMLGCPSSLPAVRQLVEGTTYDDTQAAALFAYAELAGNEGKDYLAKVKPIGDKAKKELADAVEWLKETTPDDKHGHEVKNDAEFVARFGDLDKCPTIRWLGEQKLLEDEVLAQPKPLAGEQKKRLLELLLDSRGFGLEAVKGALFLSLAKGDEAMLLRIRAAGFHAPSDFSLDRLRTIGIMVRHIRQCL